MSLATLKRKTAAKYNNMSVGHSNFSLNGTHRSQGYVGQNLRSESCMMCTNDPNIIKRSVGSSISHVQARHDQYTRNGVNNVKLDSNHKNNQQSYIENIRKTTINETETETSANTKTTDCTKSVNIIGAGGRPIFDTKPSTSFNTLSCYTTTKDLSGESKSSSSYILKLANSCAETESKLTNPSGGTPLPGTF